MVGFYIMKTYYKLLVCLLIVFVAIPLHVEAQERNDRNLLALSENSVDRLAEFQHEIRGTVTNETGDPLPGATIQLEGATTGTSTDADGNYQITVPFETGILIFSFVGYQTQSVQIEGRSEINVEMEARLFGGEELVVVGYGEQRRDRITSSIATIRSDDFAIASARDAGAMIKGRVAGLSIIEPSGDPTEDTEISLRGTISLMGSANPLILIDGVPGDFRTVAPEQIESIDVLKDGSAAAIYGSRGSNGVILITTKQNRDNRTMISYEGYAHIQTIRERIDLQSADQYRQNHAGRPQFQDYGYNTDWVDAITREPVSHSHTLTYMGGQDQTSYTASLNYRDTQGIFLNSDNEDLRARANLRHSMYDGRVSAVLNISARQQNHWQQSNNQSFDGYVYRQALIRNPTDRIYDDDGRYQIREGFNYDNPLILLNEGGGEVENREIRFDGTFIWNPIQNLSLSMLGATTRWSQQRGYAENFEHVSNRKGGARGVAAIGGNNSVDNLLELTGNFQETFRRHDINLLGGYSYQDVENSSYSMNNSDFPTDLFGWDSIQQGVALPEGRAGMGSNRTSYKLIGFFGRLNYSWDDRFMLMGSLRYEGSSRFGADNKWGMFPAISAGWMITRERFMQDVDLFSELKLRGGFGVTGIVPSSPYQSLAGFSFGGNMFHSGRWISGIVPSRNANPNLRWERKEEINVGLDFSMLDDRLWGSLDIYRRDTKDLLRNLGVPSPPFLFGSMLQNVGHIRNDGIEILMNAGIVRSSNLSWITSVTYSTNRNKLVALTDDVFEVGGTLTTGSIDEPLQMPTHRAHVGGPLGDFIGYEAVGLDETGSWIILDAEGNEIPIDQANPDDWRTLGNGIPDHHLGWNNRFRYRNFDLDVTMRGSFGFQIANWQRMYYENPAVTQYNMLNSAFDPVFGSTLNHPLENVSYYYEQGDYWKIDNVTLGYTFNLDFVQNMRVYLSARNLFTFTGYRGIDPEVSNTGLTPGLDERDKYPTTRTFTIGLNLTF